VALKRRGEVLLLWLWWKLKLRVVEGGASFGGQAKTNDGEKGRAKTHVIRYEFRTSLLGFVD
jgi:hypothetical protein